MPFVPMYVVSITTADVGRRVSVRLTADDGQLTDVVGDLLAWSGGALSIRRRDGSVAVVDETRLVAAKVVPPAATRRARPSAHRAIDAISLEEIASRGWLGLESVWLGRWLLRASEGFTGRGNSVLPLGEPAMPVEDALGKVASWYGARGLAPRFQVPLPVMGELDRTLAERGWSSYDLTHVLTASTHGLLAAAPERPDLPPVRFDSVVTEDWLTLYHYRGRELPPVAAGVLARADVPVFTSVRDGDAVVAVARGALASGWVGITALEVLADTRRRGLGTHVMRAMAAWAQERGAHSIYLQVDTANTAAVAFYDRLGFCRHHQYHYRTPSG